MHTAVGPEPLLQRVVTEYKQGTADVRINSEVLLRGR